jgi:SHS2 domain-containing protein
MGVSTDERGEPRFEEVDHTADRALRIFGATWQDLLVNAAHGLNSLLAGELPSGPRRVERSVDLETVDAESLLVAWLGELAYWAEADSQLFDRFIFHDLSSTRLRSTARGLVLARLERHVKAVTFHNLSIARDARGLSATVVFDL